MPGPRMPGNRPGQRICVYHSKYPPARRAALSNRVTHASARSCCDRGGQDLELWVASFMPKAVVA
eukprot:1455931-Lingulodinium_polyedra.AAC.1